MGGRFPTSGKKVRRGLRKSKLKKNVHSVNSHNKSNKITIMGTNANGLASKMESLYKALNVFHPTIVTI